VDTRARLTLVSVFSVGSLTTPIPDAPPRQADLAVGFDSVDRPRFLILRALLI
jgi:hypothetical protein